jgi:C1A family cysteine protease
MKVLGVISVIIVAALIVACLTPCVEENDPTDYSFEEVGYVDVEDTVFGSSFDLRDVNGVSYVTSVKNQGNHGTCWAFSTTAVLETAAISAGLADDTLDLSEVDYIYFSHKGVSSEGDIIEYHDGNNFIEGGYIQESIFDYGQWKGNLTEEATGYTYSELGYDTELDSDLQYLSDAVRLTGAYIVNENDTDSIKYMLTEKHLAGLIGFSLDAEDFNSITVDGKVIDTMYSDSEDGAYGHAVALIGYDDNFPASYFQNESVTQNGAWLCKNSWGTTEDNDGMLWISYQNASFSPGFMFFEAGSSDEYDNNYQYDNGKSILHDVSLGSTSQMANVFTSDDSEILEAASFYVLRNTEVDYTVSVYTDLNDPNDPTSGILMSTQSGTTSYSGYYTVELDDEVYLNPGSEFSVVVSLTSNDDSDVYLPIDTRERVVEEDLFFIFETVAHPGQSFISSDGESWEDISDDYRSNVRVKAFTSDI